MEGRNMSEVESGVVPAKGGEGAKGKAKRDKSKDAMGSMEARTTRVESVVATMVDQIEEMGDSIRGFEKELEDLRGNMLGALNEAVDTLRQERDAFQAKVLEAVEAIKAQVNELQSDWVIWKRSMGNGVVPMREAPRVKIPDPKLYAGARDARELENFLWHMEQYFEAIGMVEEKMKVRTATMFLTDTAMLWWRRRSADMERGTCTINTWADFKKEIKRQFYPENVEYLARKSLKRLKHTGSIRDYVKEFSTLMLEITDMPEKDLFFNFMDGLQNWAELELQRRGVQDLATAMAVAESLVEFKRSESPKAKFSKGSHAKGGGEEEREDEGHEKKAYRPSGSKYGQGKRDEQGDRRSKGKFKPQWETGCFICGGEHRARECPKKEVLNALVAKTGEEEEKEEEEPRMGALQLLNAIEGTKEASKPSKSLMYVEALVDGKATRALVDTGATHNFVSAEEAKRLKLEVAKEPGWLKAVIADARPIHGATRGVELQVGAWKGKVDLSVVPLDDHQVILGMDFLRQAKAVPMPFNRTVCFMDGGTPYGPSGARDQVYSEEDLGYANDPKKGWRNLATEITKEAREDQGRPRFAARMGGARHGSTTRTSWNQVGESVTTRVIPIYFCISCI